MAVPGVSCGLCGDTDTAGINVPVFCDRGDRGVVPAFPRICQNCLASVLGVTFGLMGKAPGRLADLAVTMHNTGRPPT
jgi:hypothetical protein